MDDEWGVLGGVEVAVGWAEVRGPSGEECHNECISMYTYYKDLL